MKLHTCHAAPSPRRVQLFLDYKQIELDTHAVDLRAGEQFEPDFLALNPRGTVPVLELDDGTALTDGMAICWFLEGLYPQRPLLGTDRVQQARILAWQQRISMDGFLAVADALRNANPAFAGRAQPGPHPCAQIADLAERGRQRIRQFLADMDAELAGRQFLLGEDFSMADIDLLVVLDFSRRFGMAFDPDCPGLVAWRERAAGRLGID